jgi:hypothetical protein
LGQALDAVQPTGNPVTSRRHYRGNVAFNDAFECDFQAGAEAMLNFSAAFR